MGEKDSTWKETQVHLHHPRTWDHFFGNPIILKDFPEAKSVANSFVSDGIKEALTEDNIATWKGMFPDQLPDGQIVHEALPANGEFAIDGHSLFGIDVVFSDTQNSSFLHVPSLDLVVSGDIVYGECFQHLGEANTPEKESIGLMHWTKLRRFSRVSLSREYIHAFEEEVKKWKDADKVEDAMKKRYPQRWNEFILSNSCKNSVAQLMEAEKKFSI
ncbi:hypothetical protein N7532_000011 [Penicillium argentinense]|uniref:Uncharacterized protein n=1 Tax=Penicillium argentinense TaxID=1131581 RepID=A0A9W9G4Q0_9EURO|nr:uncharacterized protein N7532_000011 [Penicillium argentinense]KAJ5111966.1 hypothetical protein N7532_000011 [Penicillium argentinense]